MPIYSINLKIFILSFILIFSTKSSYSQFENTDIGARPVSLGGAFTSIANNSNAVFYNPSGISQMKYREISVFFSPAPFGFKELSQGALNYVEPTKLGSFGLSVKTYGYDLYRETMAVLTYANNYQKKIYYGLNLNYYNLNIKNYGNAATFGIDVGALAYLNEYIRWGFSAFNVTRSAIGVTKEKLPSIYRTGLSLELKKDLNIILDAEKDTRHPLSIKSGIEYNLVENLSIRAGVGSEPTKFSAGVGFNYSLFEIDYAFYNHQDLGLTHLGSITINFGGSANRKIVRESLSAAFSGEHKDSVVKKNKIKKLKNGETVNINYAGLEQLMRIPHVSEKIAQAIIDYRNEVGLMESIDELLNVKGIKQKKLDKMRPYIRLTDTN